MEELGLGDVDDLEGKIKWNKDLWLVGVFEDDAAHYKSALSKNFVILFFLEITSQ